MKTERIDTESGTNHENRTNQERIMKTERIRNAARKSRITSLDPPTVEIRNDPPTVEIKSDTPTVEIKSDTPTVEIKSDTPTVEIRNKFMLDPHGGNMYQGGKLTESERMIMSYTNIEVSVDVEMMFASGEVHSVRLSGIPCKWVWGETSREAAEYWAALEHISDNYKFEWMSIKSWVGSPVKDKEV